MDANDSDGYVRRSSCRTERWPGPTEIWHLYTCEHDDAEAHCECDGEEHRVDGDYDRSDPEECLRLIEEVCGVPSEYDFCGGGDAACWGEDSPFECLCEESQELVSVEAEDCGTALRIECYDGCRVDDVGRCSPDDVTGLWHCVCVDETAPPTSAYSLDDPCEDVLAAVCSA
jgi:hypothetical protein